MGRGRIKRWFTIWRCVFLHKKEISEFRLPDDVFTFTLGRFKGCRICDVWRRIEDAPKGKAACCSVHAGGDEECRD